VRAKLAARGESNLLLENAVIAIGLRQTTLAWTRS